MGDVKANRFRISITRLEIASDYFGSDIRSNGYSWLFIIAALTPISLVIWLVMHLAVNIPFQDQWILVPQIENSYGKSLEFSDLWPQHNEHRLIIPKLIMIHLARLTDWDIRVELALNLILSAGIFVAISRLIFFVERPPPRKKNSRLFLIALVSIIFYSMNQWENWLWGWQLQIFICNLSVVAAILIISNSRLRLSTLLVSMCLGLVASCSFGSGNLIWIIGIFLLLSRRSRNGSKYGLISFWIVLTSIFLAFYCTGYKQTLPVYRMKRLLLEPNGEVWVTYISYVLKYLGAPLFPFNGLPALLAGFCGLAGFIILGSNIMKHHRKNLDEILPIFGIALYAICAGFTTGFARAQMGSDQALSSRYISISTLFWISTLFLIGVYLGSMELNRSSHLRLIVSKFVLILIFGVFSILAVRASIQGMNRAIRHQTRLESIYTAIKEDRADDEQLRYLFPNIPQLKHYLTILRKRNLSLYHE